MTPIDRVLALLHNTARPPARAVYMALLDVTRPHDVSIVLDSVAEDVLLEAMSYMLVDDWRRLRALFTNGSPEAERLGYLWSKYHGN